MSTTTIIGIRLGQRMANAMKLQEILSKHGCVIKTRLGLHEVDGGKCYSTGLILLELYDKDEAKKMLEDDLNTIKDIEIKKMEFDI